MTDHGHPLDDEREGIDLHEWFTFTEDGVTYPFVEDENANVHGYGHQDKAEFARAVNDYDVAVGGVDSTDACWDAGDIPYRWGVMDLDGERFWVNVPATDQRVEHLLVPGPVGENTPGAFPITCLWNQR